MSEFAASLVGGIIAGTMGVAASYFVTYIKIERPKLALEAHRQALALAPNVETSCSAEPTSDRTWRVGCTSRNKGTYPVLIKIVGTRIYFQDDPSFREIKAGEGFHVLFQKDKKAWRASQGAEGDLWFWIQVPSESSQIHATALNRLALVIEFENSVPDSATTLVSEAYPEAAAMIRDLASHGTRYHLNLEQKRLDATADSAAPASK